MTFIKSIALAATVAVGLSGQAIADEAGKLAEGEYKLSTAVATASKAWRDAFNAGDAAGAAAFYEEDAVMVVKPFGTFEGREAIEDFWAGIISKGFDDVVYSKTVTTVLDQTSARIAADWKMNKAHGIITNELWVLQPDGRALLREDYFEIAQ